MPQRSRIFAVAVVLTVLASAASGRDEPVPTSRPSPSKADQKVKREDLPTCTSMRVSADQMRHAYDRIVEKTGDTKMSRARFDDIGDELGCRWPEAGEEGGEGLTELLERGGGTTSGMKARPR